MGEKLAEKLFGVAALVSGLTTFAYRGGAIFIHIATTLVTTNGAIRHLPDDRWNCGHIIADDDICFPPKPWLRHHN